MYYYLTTHNFLTFHILPVTYSIFKELSENLLIVFKINDVGIKPSNYIFCKI